MGRVKGNTVRRIVARKSRERIVDDKYREIGRRGRPDLTSTDTLKVGAEQQFVDYRKKRRQVRGTLTHLLLAGFFPACHEFRLSNYEDEAERKFLVPNSLVKVSFHQRDSAPPRNVRSSLRGCESLICTSPGALFWPGCYFVVCVQSPRTLSIESFCFEWYVNNVENYRDTGYHERNMLQVCQCRIGKSGVKISSDKFDSPERN